MAVVADGPGGVGVGDGWARAGRPRRLSPSRSLNPGEAVLVMGCNGGRLQVLSEE